MDVAALAVVAKDADVAVLANDDVVAKEADTGTKVIDVAAEAVVATDELIDTLAVPNVDPL
jgi:hypothetical protein